MLIALFTILFLGGSDTGMLDFIAESQNTVKVVMDKGDRRKEVFDTLNETKKRANAYNKTVKGASKGLSKTLSGENPTDAELDLSWDVYFSGRENYNRDMLDLRFQLKDQMTREEWQQVFAEE